MLFIDDVGIKRPKTTYNNEKTTSGIHRYNLKHIQWLDAMLADIEKSGCTISGNKSQFAIEGLNIVGFVCNGQERHPKSSKVLKILEWPISTNVTEA